MIPFLDMKAVYAELKPELDAAYARVMEFGLVRARQGGRGFRGRICRFLRHRVIASAWPMGWRRSS